MSDTAKERALAELKEEKDREAMGKAYDEAASRSMGTFKEKAPKPPASASAASSPAKSKANGGKISSYAKGGVTRADGCVRKGHTKGKMV